MVSDFPWSGEESSRRPSRDSTVACEAAHFQIHRNDSSTAADVKPFRRRVFTHRGGNRPPSKPAEMFQTGAAVTLL
jgi:hypothetical protein